MSSQSFVLQSAGLPKPSVSMSQAPPDPQTLDGIMSRMMFSWVRDDSGSMLSEYTPKDGGEPMTRAASADRAFQQVMAYIKGNDTLRRMVQIAECRFGTKVHHTGFHPVDSFESSDVDVGGATMFREALIVTRDNTKRGIIDAVNSDGDYKPGLTVCISDGEFSDGPVNDIVAEMLEMEKKREGFFYGVGFTDQDKQRLLDAGFSDTQTFSLDQVSWSDIIIVMGKSINSLSMDQIPQDLQ